MHRSGWSRLALAVTVANVVTVYACGDETTEPPTVTSVVVTPDAATLVSLGETVQLVATARDGSGNTIADKMFTWTSSDESLATVSASGLVTAVANGTTSVTATTDGVSASASVTVADSLPFVLWVAEETSAILDDGTSAFRKNPAIPSLLATGGQLVSVGERFTEVIGRTFVWDSAATGYQPDDARGDAPLDGTRFVLYDADPDNRALRFPLTETGYVDVVPEADGHRVRIVVGGAAVLDFFSFGTITGVHTLPCCHFAVLGRFPRNLSAAGTIWLGEVALSFSYADTITGYTAYHDGFFQDATVSDIRRMDVLLPARGTVQLRLEVGSNVRFIDSDNFADLRVAFPAKDGGDSVVVSVGLRGIRGSLYINSFTINGRDDLLVYSFDTCGCYLYRGERINPVQIQMLDDAIRSSTRNMVLPAYLPFGVLEAILAPAIFPVR